MPTYVQSSSASTHVTSRLAANFQGWEQNNTLFETQFEKVVKALRTDAGGRPKPPPSKL